MRSIGSELFINAFQTRRQINGIPDHRIVKSGVGAMFPTNGGTAVDCPIRIFKSLPRRSLNMGRISASLTWHRKAARTQRRA